MAEEKLPPPKSSEAKPQAGAAARASAGSAKKKKLWKNVTVARACIQSSFNNTIVSITDEAGQVIVWSTAGACGFKGTEERHAVCRASHSRYGRQEGDGIGRQTGARAGERARIRPRDRDPRAAGGRACHSVDSGRHADPP